MHSFLMKPQPLLIYQFYTCFYIFKGIVPIDSWSTSTGIPKSYANFRTILEMLPNISQVTQMRNLNIVFHSSMSVITIHSSLSSHWFWVFYFCIFLHLFFSSFPMVSILGHILLTSNSYNTCWWSLPGNLNLLPGRLYCWLDRLI